MSNDPLADLLKEARRWIQYLVEQIEERGDFGPSLGPQEKPEWWHGGEGTPPDDFVVDQAAIDRASSAFHTQLVAKGFEMVVNPEEIDEIAVLVVLAFMGYKPRKN